MQRLYPDTLVVILEENYRSSGAILLAALEVIQQDESRPAKTLLPTHCVGTRPVLRKLPSAGIEALWIVFEIKRAIALTGNLFALNDIAILIRSASLSRHIESALGKSGIPYRMVGGYRFFDRAEVKIVLDYLRVISQPDSNDALARIFNVPPRRIGETTVKALLDEAETKKITLWSLVRNAVQGNVTLKTRILKTAEQGLSSFINLILSARKKLLESDEVQFSLVQLVEFLMRKLNFKEYLEKSHPEDHEARWANIEELVAQASDFSGPALSQYEEEETLPDIEGLEQRKYSSISDSLSRFLANVALSSEVKDGDEGARDQVTISTIHAAKGLEWPVVFIPAVYDGSIPHSRAEDTDEERRLLYVAMTRAKALLYMSCPMKNSQKGLTILQSTEQPLPALTPDVPQNKQYSRNSYPISP
jgi:DNA helicase-2/ATP-dependent DNA helicase PcrA